MTHVKESIAFRLRSRSVPSPSLIPREDSVRPAQSSSQPTATTGTQAVPTLAREDSARGAPTSTLETISPILINSDDDEEVYDEEDSYNSDATIPYVDSEEDDYPYHGDEEPRAKVARLSDGTVVMPNLLEGVAIPAGPARTGEECPVCLDPPVHPVTLPCGHRFCFLCAKGLTRQTFSVASCSLCRKEIPADYLDRSSVLEAAQADIESKAEDSQDWAWFYKGRRGWWMFEERNNEELEEAFRAGQQRMDMMICGQLYVIDFVRNEQYQKNMPTKKRQIKRDLKSSENEGVAGLQNTK